MRIAQIAPLYESVPPRLYGGTERVVSFLTEELVRQGHDVTLFASGDSQTSARLVAGSPRALRLARVADSLPHHFALLERVYREHERFDVLHFHVDYLHFPFSRRSRASRLTTLHGRLDLPDLPVVFGEYPEEQVVSISDAQRAPIPEIGWAGTVHHGLPPKMLQQGDGRGGYLAFLGRISPEKRADRAIEIAHRVGLPLKIAAKVDRVDEEYFQAQIAPLLGGGAEFVGEIGDREKQEFLGNAAALLFPIDWPEPFGLVLIEAMACGTPIVAFRRGSVPEIVEHGVSGVIVDDVDGAVAAMPRVLQLARGTCRAAFDRRFTAERMAADYLRIYRHVVQRDEGTVRRIA
jgi:glycosyltransferase involved in cell wall biosynthesis